MTTYRLKLATPALKMRVATKIPAQLVEGNAITITKANGVYTIGVDSTELDGMVLQAIEDNPDQILVFLGKYTYPINTNGDITLPPDKSRIVLIPTVPSVRNIYLPTGATRDITVADGNGDWDTYNVTFSVSGGTINGSATWVGSMKWGSFTFTPVSGGDYLASGIG